MKGLAREPRVDKIPLIGIDSPSKWSDSPARILIVDSEDGVREALRDFFRNLGYHSFASSDPFQALDIIRDQFIHLAILDLRLPGMDGIELQRRICDLSPDTAHIIITGYESIDSAIKTLRAGAYDYLIKPIRLPYLANVVRNCLEKRKLEIENRDLFDELHLTCEQLKEREEALRLKTEEANYYLHNILEKANDIIFTLNTEGLFTYINPKIGSLGYNREALLGNSFLSLLADEGEADVVYDYINSGRVKDMELSIKDKAGIIREMMVSLSPLHDASHALTGALVIAMDITDRKALIAKLNDVQASFVSQKRDFALERERSAEEMRLLQEYNQRILSDIPIGVALFDKENNTLQANEKFLGIFSLHVDQVISRPAGDYLPQPVLHELTSGKNGSKDLVEIRLQAGLDQEMILGLRILRLRNSEDRRGEAGHTLLLVDDISRSKMMERELLRLERVNSMLQLATGVAHEVRNPLSIIIGSIKYLRSLFYSKPSEEGEDREIIEHLDVMTESCGFMESIINELLNFARPASLIFKPIDINTCLEKTVSLLKSRCLRQKVETLFDLDRGIRSISCDEQHIGQVFINLIINAIQAMPDGGRLTIFTRNAPINRGIVVGFKDTGRGISKEALQRIFEPFFSTKSKGIGLGLAVTKRIIEDHYGVITVESSVGKGTEFKIFLPYRSQQQGE